ncbi:MULTISPECIES: hypothetical protein [unclassified Comamonas]|uniref:hypothetical protein n=1 Tax=unclassified Comamonas TaxID=2638500 RepID=UPI001FA744EF|nr:MULTISPECIES: hypothetical protein [unclassified Comamonas]UNV88555.1 hypothetical protein MP576_12875 [Comamonas sp. 7D-2evo1]UNV93542.1 hypothetical protein MPZ60_13495 [Comamonas sp. 7D-2]UNV98198.1 hypothetical protein MP579_12855 [Comamonas sp. 7D-2evo2]
MTISLYELLVTGPDKKPASLKLDGQSHLVFGPTDTGKSYIVECFRYCLGGGDKPKDVGYSEGYTRAALQVELADGRQFTLFRDLFDGAEVVYEGFHVHPPQNRAVALDQGVSELLPIWCDATDMKILAKAGQLGNLTAGDLRRVSIFDEIGTLDNVPFEGKDTNLKTRNKSALAVILRGSDDSEMLLPPSTNDRNVAKGHVEAINEQITSLLADVPDGLTLKNAQEGLAKVTDEIEAINLYMKNYASELAELKQARLEIDKEGRRLFREFSALKEAENRFRLLDKKYVSDQQRLQAVASAASVATSFETRPCPLCRTDIQHQLRHQEQNEKAPMLRLAALAENEKISGLREGLKGALQDVLGDLKEATEAMRSNEKEAHENDQKQNTLLAPKNIDTKNGLTSLSQRKAELTVAVSSLSRVDSLKMRLAEMKEKSKRKKQIVDRDMSESSTALCTRVKELLDDWGVPGVEAIHFDDGVSDIEINHRKRTSYGKGKRGIFLAAYMVALMERAVDKGHPHLGLTVIDSPVVTYKDPKHGADSDGEELLDESVKDRFYAWLANRAEPGQIIILENEEPSSETLRKLNFTEFVGAGNTNGRSGFFPA